MVFRFCCALLTVAVAVCDDGVRLSLNASAGVIAMGEGADTTDDVSTSIAWNGTWLDIEGPGHVKLRLGDGSARLTHTDSVTGRVVTGGLSTDDGREDRAAIQSQVDIHSAVAELGAWTSTPVSATPVRGPDLKCDLAPAVVSVPSNASTPTLLVLHSVGDCTDTTTPFAAPRVSTYQTVRRAWTSPARGLEASSLQSAVLDSIGFTHTLGWEVLYEPHAVTIVRISYQTASSPTLVPRCAVATRPHNASLDILDGWTTRHEWSCVGVTSAAFVPKTTIEDVLVVTAAWTTSASIDNAAVTAWNVSSPSSDSLDTYFQARAADVASAPHTSGGALVFVCADSDTRPSSVLVWTGSEFMIHPTATATFTHHVRLCLSVEALDNDDATSVLVAASDTHLHVFHVASGDDLEHVQSIVLLGPVPRRGLRSLPHATTRGHIVTGCSLPPASECVVWQASNTNNGPDVFLELAVFPNLTTSVADTFVTTLVPWRDPVFSSPGLMMTTSMLTEVGAPSNGPSSPATMIHIGA